MPQIHQGNYAGTVNIVAGIYQSVAWAELVGNKAQNVVLVHDSFGLALISMTLHLLNIIRTEKIKTING